uniref:Uncharacterized protein n=1 Tax=Timema bartmani TaxID=61472 RepID=A0A7R9I7U1_9NEOP|nr:unnamed protein product [Timema bartmani]
MQHLKNTNIDIFHLTGGNVGFELGRNMAEGNYGNNTIRQASAAKRRSDAKSLAGKMPNRTRAGVLERQRSYANMVLRLGLLQGLEPLP